MVDKMYLDENLGRYGTLLFPLMTLELSTEP
jgi:hypothetical protein